MQAPLDVMASLVFQSAPSPDEQSEQRRRKIEEDIRLAEQSGLPEHLIEGEVAALRRLLAEVDDPLRYAVTRYLLLLESGLQPEELQFELEAMYSRHPGKAKEINALFKELST